MQTSSTKYTIPTHKHTHTQTHTHTDTACNAIVMSEYQNENFAKGMKEAFGDT